MPAILRTPAAGAYGAVRGYRDATKDTQEEEAFQGDQAIRKERLGQEQGMAPLRRRALDLQLSAGERQNETAGIALGQAKRGDAEMVDAKEKEKKLNIALGQFHLSGDPTGVANVLNDIYPNPDGKAEAKRNDDNSITISSPKMQAPITFRAKKIDGQDRTPDDQFSMYVFRLLNPVAALRERADVENANEKEGVKQSGAERRAVIAGDARISAAEARADVARGRAVDRGVKLAKTYVDSSLKTVSVPGHFQATYSSEDDAKLLPHIYKRANALVRENDAEPEVASEQAIREVRTNFLTSKKKALDAAQKLQKEGFDPKDRDALTKAQEKGHGATVAEYLRALGAVKREFGDDVGNYLLEQVPSKKK